MLALTILAAAIIGCFVAAAATLAAIITAAAAGEPDERGRALIIALVMSVMTVTAAYTAHTVAVLWL